MTGAFLRRNLAGGGHGFRGGGLGGTLLAHGVRGDVGKSKENQSFRRSARWQWREVEDEDGERLKMKQRAAKVRSGEALALSLSFLS